MNPGHQPERFLVYNQLPTGTGFTLPDNPYVFLYDRYGGWEDEYGNYYNEHGMPDDPPSSQDSHSHSGQRSPTPEESEDDDPYQAQFGVPHDVQSSDQDDGGEEAGRIQRNLFNLQGYPQEQPLRVYFRNLPFKTRKDELMKAYSSQVDQGLLNAVIDTDEDGKVIGTGYFVTTVACAGKIVKLQGKRLLNRPLAFQIQQYENFMVFPVTERESSYEPPPPKKYVLKQPLKTQQKEQEVALQKEEVKWKWYKFKKDLFPKKTQFVGWMSERGFNVDQDFRNIGKNDTEYAKVEMKESVFTAINNLPYKETPVEFFPI